MDTSTIQPPSAATAIGQIAQVLTGSAPSVSLSTPALPKVPDPRETFLDFFHNTNFPGGEVHTAFDTGIYDKMWSDYMEWHTAMNLPVSQIRNKYPTEIQLALLHGGSDHLMTVVAQADAAKLLGVRFVDLLIMYMPYGRQDRVENKGESFMIKPVAQLLNSTFRHITVVDAHSPVTTALLRRPVEIRQYQVMQMISDKLTEEGVYNPFMDPSIILVAPDVGAEKKARYVGQAFNKTVLQASKVRDTKDGSLTGFALNVPSDVKIPAGVSKFLIVDDLIDAGGTFIGLAKTIKAKCPLAKVYLATSYALFSKGVDHLLANGIDGIYVGDFFYKGNANTVDKAMEKMWSDPASQLFSASLRYSL